jgi:hypothetical protein
MTVGELAAVVEKIRQQRYPSADVVLLAGSVVRGSGTATSDLDLVVLFNRLPRAYRESFHFDGWPVETFAHDLETLRYFFLEQDGPRGIPILMNMVAEGIEVPAATTLSTAAKRLARQVIEDGPVPWSAADIDRSRYMITCFADDLRDPRSRAEGAASASVLYAALANHYFRCRGLWSAQDKSIPRYLAAADAALAAEFDSAFAALYSTGDAASVIELAAKVLESHGGWLFDGYRADAPPEWRRDQ